MLAHIDIMMSHGGKKDSTHMTQHRLYINLLPTQLNKHHILNFVVGTKGHKQGGILRGLLLHKYFLKNENIYILHILNFEDVLISP